MGKCSYVGYDSQVIHTQIGSFCSIGDFFLCGGANHPADWVSTSSAFYGGKHNGNSKHFASFEIPHTPRTYIGNDVWCGARVIVKAGVNIGTGAIIGTGSVVTHDVPPYAIVAGVPAKIIRYRFNDDIINRLLESKWWELSDKQLKSIAPYIRRPEEFLLKIEEINKVYQTFVE
jgi:chloramphenicol O-acetyltransferase type B